MLEILYLKARGGLARSGAKPGRRRQILPPALWIVLLTIGLVGGRWIWVKASRPAQRQESTAALGSGVRFSGTPQISHDGSQFIYVATGDKGYALFLGDASTGKRRIVAQEYGSGSWQDDVQIWARPWSPDDRAFTFTIGGDLIIYPVDSNQPPLKLTLEDTEKVVPQKLGTKTITDLVWLNPAAFVWLERPARFGFARKMAGGVWKFRKFAKPDETSNLTVIDTNTIAWLQNGMICQLDVTEAMSGTNNPFVARVKASPSRPPLLTNNLILHLDASTLRQGNGTLVTNLPDLSDRKNFAVPNRNPPIYIGHLRPGSLAYKGTIEFTSGPGPGRGLGLKTSQPLGLSGTHPRSIFAVISRKLDNRSEMWVSTGSGTGPGELLGLAHPKRRDVRLSGLGLRWNLLENIYDGKQLKSYVDGKLWNTRALVLNTIDRELEIGLVTKDNSGTNGVAASNGNFAELLVYDRDLSSADQQQVEDYLNAKWFGNKLIPAKLPLVWFNPKLTGLSAFDYDPATGRLLLHCKQMGRDSLWQVTPNADGFDAPVPLQRGTFIKTAKWTGDDQFAYISSTRGHRTLTLADKSGQQADSLFLNGDCLWFQAFSDQGKMFFLGSVSNEPAPGIWQYDFRTSELKSLAPWSAQASAAVRKLPPHSYDVWLASGRKIRCTMFPPADFDRHKRYPLLIGNTVLRVEVMGDYNLNQMANYAHGRLWPQALAAAGAFVVIVDRSSWYVEIEQWEKNVRGVYESLAHDPCIDPGQVFLFGASAETPYLSRCLAKTPGLWKGGIYLSPAGLPDFSESPPGQPRPRILISAGGEDASEDSLKKNQLANLNHGVVEEIIIHAGEPHRMLGNAGQLERTKAMMHFIFEE